MSTIDQIIAEEAEDLQRYDTSRPLPDHVKVTRPGREEIAKLRERLAALEADRDYWRNEYNRVTASRWAA